jgi:hypothetical protein
MSKTKAERFRIMAAECERQAELAAGEEDFREMQKNLANSYHALAETEDWLDGRSEHPAKTLGGAAEKTFEAA